MAFAGDFTPVLAKHSKSFSLIDCISVGVDRMQRNFEPMASPGAKACRLDELPGCTETVSKPLLMGGSGALLERKADAPSCCFHEKSSEQGERLERACLRPRQVRYQAALRPDSNCFADSKPLPRTAPPQELELLPGLRCME